MLVSACMPALSAQITQEAIAIAHNDTRKSQCFCQNPSAKVLNILEKPTWAHVGNVSVS